MESSYQGMFLIAAGTVVMLLLVAAIILFLVFYQKKMIQEQVKRQELEIVHQQKMMEAALESQENERRRVAGDLHDSIGAMLSAIRLGLITLGRQMPNPGAIDETKEMLDETIGSVRRISRDLMPSTLEKFGLSHAIKELCERFQSTSQLPIHYHVDNEPKPIDPKKELMIFRIVQELLNNAIKHAKSTHISITLRSADTFQIIVEDDGVGFNLDEQNASNKIEKGLGLFNIENRTRLLDATIEFDKERKKGTRTILTVPYETGI
ncbi:MAG TPA: sensor histidine kinase [Chryseolinea sp.]|nr:sensor histidine kinase [Chryseolinea sp.]